MIVGTLFDPISNKSVEARIPTWFKRNRNVYSIPVSFKVKQRAGLFTFGVKDGTRYFRAKKVEHYAIKFDRIWVDELNIFEFIEELEKVRKNKKVNEELKICQKRRYDSKEEAEEMIKHIIKFPESPGLRPYKCRTCNNWHLTSKITKLTKKKRKRTL